MGTASCLVRVKMRGAWLCMVIGCLSAHAITVQNTIQEGEITTAEVAAALDLPGQVSLSGAISDAQLELKIDQIQTEGLFDQQKKLQKPSTFGTIGATPSATAPSLNLPSLPKVEKAPSIKDLTPPEGSAANYNPNLYCDDYKRCPDGMWCHNNQCALMSGTFVANPTVVAPASGSGYVSPFDLDTHIMSLQEKVKDLPDHTNRLTEPDWALLNELQKWRLKQASGYIPSSSTGSASTEINLDKIKTEFLGNPQ